MFQLIYTCGMNTMYLWDFKAGSFVGCSAITVSRGSLNMVLGEEIPLPGIKPHSLSSWPAISQIHCCQLWVYVPEKY
jgi:hypothetical protein